MIHLPLPYPAASASPPPCAYPTAVARRLLHQRRRLLTPTPLPSLSSAPPSPPPTPPRGYGSPSPAAFSAAGSRKNLPRRRRLHAPTTPYSHAPSPISFAVAPPSISDAGTPLHVARHPDRRRSKIGVTVAGVNLAPLSASQSPAMISWPRTFVAVSIAFAAADPASPVRRRRLRSGGPRLCPRPPRSAPLQPVQQHRHCRQEQHPRPDCQQTTR